MAREEFDGHQSSGGIVDFTFTVTDAYFRNSPAYAAKGGGDVLFMHWLGTTDLEEHPVLGDGEKEFHPSWKLGPDWSTFDNGKTVVYQGQQTSGKPKLGGGPGGYAGFLSRVLEITQHVANQPNDPLGGDNRPQDASIWIGTQWFMEEVVTQPGTQWEKRVLMPAKYLGKVAVTPGAAPAPAVAAPVAPVAAAPVTAAAPPAGGNNEALRAQLKALAVQSPDFKSFQAQALAMAGIMEDLELLTAVTNESGIWAEVH